MLELLLSCPFPSSPTLEQPCRRGPAFRTRVPVYQGTISFPAGRADLAAGSPQLHHDLAAAAAPPCCAQGWGGRSPGTENGTVFKEKFLYCASLMVSSSTLLMWSISLWGISAPFTAGTNWAGAPACPGLATQPSWAELILPRPSRTDCAPCPEVCMM